MCIRDRHYIILTFISHHINILIITIIIDYKAEWEKVWSRLSAHLQPFFRLLARILTIFDKKYHILTCCDKRESYLVLL